MNAEVIVVGAGIVGSACAHELARRGLDVLVLDSRRGGATAVGMGHLVAMDDNPAELALSDYSIQGWRAWAADLPEDCAYRNCGTLWLAADASELAEAERKRQALQAAGVACRMPVSYTHLRAHETSAQLVCRLLLEKKKVLIASVTQVNGDFVGRADTA
ncbi:NAD(P)/FAD-dependent oxidoreductase, partial [Pseudomonas aeruginosa]|uniref:NAD(P)/FAD-dependent oxidoreductase n=1 Tax=Pseudomonas aeruginosa TaxID=287 RepID=UPI0027E441C0